MADKIQRLIVGYAIFSLFFISSLFVFIVVRIDMLSTYNQKRIEKALTDLAAKINSNFSNAGNFAEKEMSELFNKALENEPRFLAILVHSKNYGVLKALLRSKEYLLNAQYGDFKSPILYQKPTGTAEVNIPLTLSFKEHSLGVVLSSLYISFSTFDSTILLGEILYILCAYFGLTLAMLIITTLISRKSKPVFEATKDSAFDLKAEKLENNNLKQSVESFEAGIPPHIFKAEERNLASETPFPEEDLVIPEEEPLLDLEQEIKGPAPEELFSRSTGLVKNQFFKERLAGELRRALSVDQDLSLLLISLDSVTTPDFSLKRNFTDILHRFFPLHELCFEYEKGLVAVILPDEDSNYALKSASTLFKELLEEGVKVTIGISSRANRTNILPELLLNEAEGALTKAYEEKKLPVIAFRPDPEKFSKMQF